MPELKKDLATVAKIAGVSIATVSRALNGKPGVSKAKAQQINKIVKELGLEVRFRRTGSSATTTTSIKPDLVVAIIVGGRNFLDFPSVFLRQLNEILVSLANSGATAVISTSLRSIDDLPPLLRDRKIDGVLYFGDVPIDVESHFKAVPSVWMTSHREGSNVVVLPGNEEAGKIAADFFHSRGIESIGVLDFPLNNSVLSTRCDAFQERASFLGLQTLRISSSQDFPVESFKWSQLRSYKGLDDMVSKSTGLFAPTDLITAKVYPYLQGKNFFSKAKSLVISCGGNDFLLEGLDPKPVLIDMGWEAVGRLGADQIISLIRSKDKLREIQISIKPEIIVPD